MKLLVVVASTRPHRAGPAVADWFLAQLPADAGLEIDVADLAEVALPFLDEPVDAHSGGYVHAHTHAWSARVDAADAFVLVMPEYNRSYTAPLKNALDYLATEWQGKPVAFVSYGMSSGGMRAVEAITPVVVALGMVPVASAVTVHLRRRLGADGRIHDDDGTLAAAARSAIGDLRRYAVLLRENVRWVTPLGAETASMA
ncbi:NAD(P)H-dependent oxidoreductase [Cellulosimicrobium terreum]|nr:NAD(P)H-dependent oxidoreductase [Cellulosimicrobium terreum]